MAEALLGLTDALLNSVLVQHEPLGSGLIAAVLLQEDGQRAAQLGATVVVADECTEGLCDQARRRAIEPAIRKRVDVPLVPHRQRAPLPRVPQARCAVRTQLRAILGDIRPSDATGASAERHPHNWKLSSGGLQVVPGGGFVVELAAVKTGVEDDDPAVGELAQRLAMDLPQPRSWS